MSFRNGDIIVRADSEYPDGALVVDGFDANHNLLSHPMGGGLQIAIPAPDVRYFQITDAFERTPIFRAALFSIEGVDAMFRGWTDSRRWNGWAMPRFEFEEAKRVIVALCHSSGLYDENSDAFITSLDNAEEEVWLGEMVDLPDGGKIKVYPVGAGYWIWDEEEAP